MTAAEARVRAAMSELTEAIVAALAEEPELGPAPDRLLNIPEAAQRLGLGRSALYGLIDRGDLRTLKVGRRRLIPASAIAAYIAAAPPPRTM